MKDLCTLFFTVLALSLGAQESLSPDQKPPPPPESFSLTPMPDDLWAQMRYDGRPVPNIQDLAVLGWSEEGKIAILTGNYSPFRPDFSATFQIIDLVTDTRRALLGPQSMQDVIEEYGIMGDPLPGNPENPMSLEYFYALNQNKIYRLMIQEGIRPQSGFFGQGALLQEDRDIRFALKVLNKTPRSDLGEPVVYQEFAYQIWAEDRARGSKLLGQRSYDTAYLLGAEVLGHILSPFENRVAVIVAETSWGLELEYTTDFDLYGSHLDLGFEN
jgi:hypothetical protein